VPLCIRAFVCRVAVSRSDIPIICVRDSEIALNGNGQENTKSVWPQDGREVIQGWS